MGSYGDFSPDAAFANRAFCIFLIVIGILVIAARLTAVISILTRPFSRWASRRLDELFPPGKTIDKEGRHVMPSRYVFYGKRLLPTLCLNLVLQLLSAALFAYVEDWNCARRAGARERSSVPASRRLPS